MSHKFKTSIRWHDSRGGEVESDVIVIYERRKGYAGDRIDPPEDASVEIISVNHAPPDPEAPTIPVSFLEDDALVAECFEHWADDDARGEEYRAEQRADDLMRERWA